MTAVLLLLLFVAVFFVGLKIGGANERVNHASRRKGFIR